MSCERIISDKAVEKFGSVAWRKCHRSLTDIRKYFFNILTGHHAFVNWFMPDMHFKSGLVLTICEQNSCILKVQKQPLRRVLKKRCSENMQQSYRRTTMPKCDFNKVALQLYWNCTSAWVFSCKSAAYFQNTFS